ncbi:mitochondrial 54S ribosomal protein mL57 SCDLUD_001565 [Saccharomycodes ludwigii]|uniref:mitochondrial 54S ribosomal protein mL57 n=1 Tax=Saccharomycodes ludwigii TaxID=36035 RepID=UPI001E82A943|nr:hypothetical protein SCDLUD_001565 [Saccharomycodes ludwigii]KAH3901786.1 hypothetical protein SCDLUD_001565 [Saccharomycodes ludwigii]
MFNGITKSISTKTMIIPSFSIRCITTYLHTGARVRGLKRDPTEYLKTSNGLEYMKVNQDNYYSIVKKNLKLDEYQIKLADSIILQSLTHKSFAHGLKPYNEKLSLLGGQLLKLVCASNVINIPPSSSTSSSNNNFINGKDLSILGTSFGKGLLSKEVVSNIFETNFKLDGLVFWKKRSLITANDNFNGEQKVFASCLQAIVGAMLLTNGKEKTIDYINKEIYNHLVKNIK